MSLAITTNGAEISIESQDSSGFYIRIPEVRRVSVGLIAPKWSTEDVSSFDTAVGSRDLLTTGNVDFDDVQIDLNWAIGHPIHEQLITQAKSGEITNFKLKEPGPNGKTTPFGAIVSVAGGSELAPRAGAKVSFSLAPTNIGTRA